MTGETTTAPARTGRQIGVALVVASVLGSTLGIVVSQFVDNFGVGLLAEILGGDAVMYNNRVEFTGASDLAWGGGFVLCLLIGFICLFAYPTVRDQGVSRLVFLWVILHLLRQGMMQAIMLPFDDGSRLALAYDTFDVPAGLDMVIAAGGGIGLLLVALSAAAAFLAFTPHRRLVANGRRRATLALWLVVIPAVASAFVAIPFFLPDAESLVVKALPYTPLMFLATLAAAPGTTTVEGPESERVTPLPIGLLVFLGVVLIFHLLVLQGGFAVDPREWG